jgi:hypothetical protein
VLKNSKVLAAACIGLGVLLGYVAASGRLNPFQKADAARSVLDPAPEKAAAGPSSPSCCAGANKSELLALARQNDEVKTKAEQSGKKPNILILWGDDIGQFNISAYNMGMMGYKTPNIDRIAKEGALFTDWYGQQSCTAGRAAFITGQSPIRTGLTKVGLPGAKEGITAADPTLANLLEPMGYICGQFGKNHLGDRNDMLPTVHGFDEWFGNLYHLNAEEEPENVDYPKDPKFKAMFGPRGVLHC